MSEAKPEGPNNYNPVEYDEGAVGGQFVMAVRVTRPDPCGDSLGYHASEEAVVTSTGWRQWQYAGRGYSYLYEFADGSRKWDTGIMGEAFVLKRISKGGSK